MGNRFRSSYLLLDCPCMYNSCTLSTGCMYCSCSHAITGQVRSTQGRPLINVTVTPLNTPDVILATSDVSGMFEMTSACGYQSYTFTGDGFVSADVIFDENTSYNVTLERKGKEFFDFKTSI